MYCETASATRPSMPVVVCIAAMCVSPLRGPEKTLASSVFRRARPYRLSNLLGQKSVPPEGSSISRQTRLRCHCDLRTRDGSNSNSNSSSSGGRGGPEPSARLRRDRDRGGFGFGFTRTLNFTCFVWHYFPRVTSGLSGGCAGGV